MENNNDIDDLFREIIEPSGMNHSEKVWASLDNHLEKKSNERDKAIIFRLRITVGTLLFLFGSFVLYYFLNTRETNKESLSGLSKKESLKTSHSIDKNYITTNSNFEENNSSKEQVLSGNNTSVKRTSTLNQTDTQSRSAKTQLPNTVFPVKTNSVHNISLAMNETTDNNPSNEINSVIEKKNNSLRQHVTDSLGAQSIKDVTPETVKKDSSEIVNNGLAINSTDKTNVAAFSKEKFDSVQKKQIKDRFSVLAYFSPDFTMKYLKDNNKADNQNEGDYNNSEVADFSYNTGLLLGYDISKNWSVKFGGTYAYLEQTIKPKTVFAKTGSDGLAHYQFNTSYGTSELPRDQSSAPIIGDSININSNSIQSLQIIGIPLIAKYQIKRNKFSYYAQLGASLNFLIAERLYVETPIKPTKISNSEGMNEYYFGGILGLGVSYNPSKKLSILLEPTVRGAITPIKNNAPITTRPISLGLAIGIGWHF